MTNEKGKCFAQFQYAHYRKSIQLFNEQEIKPITKFIKIKKGKRYLNLIIEKEKEVGGLYAFWWLSDNSEFINKFNESGYHLKPKVSSTSKVGLEFNCDWLPDTEQNNRRICLYIGKTTNLQKRISGHLKLQTDKLWNDKDLDLFEKKPNTVNQLRIGIERVFGKNSFLSEDEVINNIGISYLSVSGYESSIDRFYLENFLIGHYLPVFNVDIER